MTCSQCKHFFCWICGADDESYKHTGGAGQSCDQKQNELLQAKMKEVDEAKQKLFKFDFNFERFNEERNNYALCKKYMEKLKESL